MNANDLSREISLYQRRKAEFEKEHHWEWVVIHEEEVVGFYDDFQDAAQIAVERFGRGPYLIRQIGIPKRSLPISILCHPVYADH